MPAPEKSPRGPARRTPAQEQDNCLTIASMADPQREPSFGSPSTPGEKPSRLPWIIAGAVVVLVIAVLVVAGHRSAPDNPGGAGLAPADPYAATLPLSHVQMSQSDTRAGGQTTYIDGQVTNSGNKTVTAITVQVAFHDFTNQIAQKETTPLNLVRTREPYVDTQPVRAAPIAPGETRDFRLIFDHVSENWNQQYPEIRVIQVGTR